MENKSIAATIRADGALREFVMQYYDFELESADLLKDMFNIIFAAGDKILRFSLAQKKSWRELSTEVTWLQHLRSCGLDSVVGLVPSTAGNFIEKASLNPGPESDRIELYIVCFSRLKGEAISAKSWTKAHFVRVGELVGKMHAANTSFPIDQRKNFVEWDRQSKTAPLEKLPDDDRQLPALGKKLSAIMNTYPKTADRYGIVHYDVHRGNYLLDEDRINLFDFEMVCNSWYEQDVAIVLYYAHFFNQLTEQFSASAFTSYFLEHFMRGYRQHHSLDLSLDRIAHFLLYRDVLVYAFVLDVWQDRVLTEKDKTFKAVLERNILQRREELGL